MNIVKEIDKIRVSKGWSFYKLGRESGVAHQTILKWMEGNTDPFLKAIKNIYQAYEIIYNYKLFE